MHSQLPFTAIEFPLYEFLKVRLARHLGRKHLEPYEAACCGSVAGGFGAAATTPFDVLKTRVMLDVEVKCATLLCRYICSLLSR